MLSRRLLLAWGSWCELIDELERMRRVVSVAMNAAVSRAFNAWCGFAEGSRDSISLMDSCLRRALNRTLVGALDRWREARGEARLLRKFGVRMVRAGLARAWGSWLELRQDRAMMQRFLRRMLNRAAVQAIGTWCTYLEQAAQMRAVLLRSLNAALTRAFNAYATPASPRTPLPTRCAETGATREGARQLARLAPPPQREAGVLVHTPTPIHTHAHIHRPGGRLASPRLAPLPRLGPPPLPSPSVPRPERSWVSNGEEVGRLRIFATRMRNGGLVKGLASWSDFVESQGRMRAAAARLGSISCSRAFNSWVEAAEGSRGERDALRKAITRMMNVQLAAGYDKWAELVGYVPPPPP